MNASVVRNVVTALSLLLVGALVVAQDKPKGKPPVEEEEAPKKKPDDKKADDKKPADGKKPTEEEEAPKKKPDDKKPADSKKPSEDDAPKPSKPVPKGDEEEAPKPKKPVPRDDEGPARPPRAVPRDDDNTPPKPRPGNANAVPADKFDFAADAKKATHPDVKRLYQAVAIPADRLQLKQGDTALMVEPIPDYIGNKVNNKPITYRALNADGTPGVRVVVANPGQIVKAVSYEEYVLDEVAKFRADMPNYLDGHPRHLAVEEYLGIADRVMTALDKFHQKALKENKREGPGWAAVTDHLAQMTRIVLSDELSVLRNSSKPGAADKAADVATRMADLFPNDVQAQREIALWEVSLAENDLSKNDEIYFKAADKLKKLQMQFATADTRVLEPLRDALRRRSNAHFDEAKRLQAKDDGKPAAQRQIEMARKIWDTPDLQDYQKVILRDFRMLVVGVKRLPEMMSPAMAITDSDRWACELMFESLVRAVPDGRVGCLYEPGLALRLPRTVSMGREFELPRNAVWVDKDGKTDTLDSSDVRGTLSMLQDPQFSKLPIAANVDLLSPPSIRDSFSVPLRLERGYLDPLELMNFKILPARRLATTDSKLLDANFATNPVGSGPFVYHGRVKEDGKEYALFRANPEFSKRTGRFGQPRIQEIRFVVTPVDPVPDLQNGHLDMVLDVPSADVMKLREPAYQLSKVVTDYTLWSRRIWMLAVNHRKPDLGDSDKGRHFRRAIAFALNREEIVKTVFRANTQHHRAMDGPFPPGTWACPESPRKLFSLEEAGYEAGKSGIQQVTLKLVDDIQSRQACAKIKEMVGQVGINVNLMPMSPADFHKAVMLERDYELAYMPYDFNSEMFSLRSLFDADARDQRGGRNFLGYVPDAKLGDWITKLSATRDFTEIKKLTHLLYRSFDEQMPFVPLWQLDFNVLLSQKLDTLPSGRDLDPLTIFDMVEEWRLNR